MTTPGAPGRAPRRALALGAAVLTLLVGACSSPGAGSPSPRAVTAAESQILAIARFKNFDAGTRSVSVELTDAGHALGLDGWFDYAAGVGYASLTDAGSPNNLITWQAHAIAVHAPAGAAAPLPPPGVATTVDETWRTGPLDPTVSTLHAALIFIEELGATRPENPLLLQQGGALWLRDDNVGGTPVTVFAGPTGLAATPGTATASPTPGSSRVHYWVDATGLLLRVEVLFGTAWVTIDLGPADGVSLPWSIPEPTA